MYTFKRLGSFFILPLIILGGIGLYCWLYFVNHQSVVAAGVAIILIVIGSFEEVKEIITALRRKQFAVDYIAILAILVGIFTGEYLIALVIVLMLTSGKTLERFALARATESLTALTDRIPNETLVLQHDGIETRRKVADIHIGEILIVRKGEVVPLDGTLLSKEALLDESSLTGEPYTREKVTGDAIRSGTINLGETFQLRVTKIDKDSTYRKIINLVAEAQKEKAPLLRLADRYSTIFTLATLGIALVGFALSHEAARVLAVLVVATPCPLILATPIALFGGLNAAAKQRVLAKNLSSLEILADVTAVVLDKTGTLTIGLPVVSALTILDTRFTEKEIYSVAAALERNSLHPLAKAIVIAAKEIDAPRLAAERVQETIGSGVAALIGSHRYSLAKTTRYHYSNAVELHEDETIIARFQFEERLKNNASEVILTLEKLGLHLHIFTGDREENARAALAQLGAIGHHIEIKANCSPFDKKTGIAALQKAGQVVAMVGDGLNDAPALASANVGIVFSNEEHTAASEAADIIFLAGDLSALTFIISLAKHTRHIALQSIWCGIGLSLILMIFAALGFVPPLFGALLQEGIDVAVILNALRAGTYSKNTLS